MTHEVGCRSWNTGCDGDCDCRSFADLDAELDREARLRTPAARAAPADALRRLRDAKCTCAGDHDPFWVKCDKAIAEAAVARALDAMEIEV